MISSTMVSYTIYIYIYDKRVQYGHRNILHLPILEKAKPRSSFLEAQKLTTVLCMTGLGVETWKGNDMDGNWEEGLTYWTIQ